MYMYIVHSSSYRVQSTVLRTKITLQEALSTCRQVYTKCTSVSHSWIVRAAKYDVLCTRYIVALLCTSTMHSHIVQGTCTSYMYNVWYKYVVCTMQHVHRTSTHVHSTDVLYVLFTSTMYMYYVPCTMYIVAASESIECEEALGGECTVALSCILYLV